MQSEIVDAPRRGNIRSPGPFSFPPVKEDSMTKEDKARSNCRTPGWRSVVPHSAELADVLVDWMAHLYEQHQAVHHLDMQFGA